jgi:ABC-type glycerol-3-phosphate transport system substrate-binding protein
MEQKMNQSDKFQSLKVCFTVFSLIMAATFLLGSCAESSGPKTIQIYIPWGVESVEGTDPMANAFRAWFNGQGAKKFPGLQLKVITASWDEHWSWLKTRIASREAPDVVVQRVDQGHGYVTPTVAQENAGQSFWISLDDIMEKTNPYTGRTLLSEYSPAHIGAAKGPLKHLYYLPISQGARAFIYDTDAFQKAGIPKAPETAAEFLSMLEKLKAAGYKYPIGGTGQATDGGFAMDIANGLAASSLLGWFREYAGMNDINPEFKPLYEAFAAGRISYSDPRIKAILEYQKKIAAFVDPATYSRNFDQVWSPFAKGEFPVMSEFNGRFIRLNGLIKEGNTTVKNVGSFNYPVADKATFPSSDALLTLPGQLSPWGCTFSISGEAKTRGTYEAAVDFLQWWASGAQDDYAWNRDDPAHANGDVPPTRSAINAWRFKSAGEALLKDFAPGWGALMLAPNGSIQEKVYPMVQGYLQGQLDYAQMAKKVDEILISEAKIALAKM